MAAEVTGSKTLTSSPTPHLTAAHLTDLFATAPENLTIANLHQLLDAVSRGVMNDPSKTLGQLLA